MVYGLPLYIIMTLKKTKGLRAFIAAFAIALAVPATTTAGQNQYDCPPELLKILHAGPHGQSMAWKKVKTPEGFVYVIGTDLAMKNVDPGIAGIHGIVETISGASKGDVVIARGVAGSFARLKVAKVANDLDGEAALILKVREGNIANLNNPASTEIKKIVAHFKEHVETVLQNHPDYIFIELKAGEFLEPVTKEVKGIKWWLDDVRKGYKTIIDASGTRTVTLEQVFADNARIKVDWAIPAPVKGPVDGAYTEASMLYRLGMKVDDSQPGLRPGSKEVLPIRSTTVTLGIEDMSILLEASRGAETLPIEIIHQSFMGSIKKMQHGDHLKILKRVYALLQFWEVVGDYNILFKARLTVKKLNRDILAILQDPVVLEFGQLRAQAELLNILKGHNITKAETLAKTWTETVSRKYGIKKTGTDEMLAAIETRLNSIIAGKLTHKPHVRSYVNYVLERIPYAKGEMSKTPLFVAMKPKEQFIASLKTMLDKWKIKYPHLKFISPDDAHMTTHFTGRLSDTGASALKSQIRGQGEGWTFSNGGFHIFGRNNDLVALVFDAAPAQARTVSVIKAQAGRFGARPEKTFRHFTPHLTLASFDKSSDMARAEARQFLAENAETLKTIQMNGMDLYSTSGSQHAAGGVKYTVYAQ